jgi:hypothetical protein
MCLLSGLAGILAWIVGAPGVLAGGQQSLVDALSSCWELKYDTAISPTRLCKQAREKEGSWEVLCKIV